MLKQSVYFLSLIMLLLVAFAFVERAFSPFFQQCVQNGQNANANSPAENNPPSMGGIFTYIRCSGEFVDRNTGSITALATIIIAAFTGTLWVATSRQAQLTKEALIADKRAFVFVTGFNQAWTLDPATNHYNWRFRPVLRNSGETPTKKLMMYVDCEIRNTCLPPGYTFNYQSSNTSGGTIPPKFELQGGLAPRFPSSGVTPQDIIDSQAGRKYIYLWGWLKYNDVFPGTKEHITRYCWLITPVGGPMTFIPNTPGQPPTPGALTFPYSYHTEGNCIDDECS